MTHMMLKPLDEPPEPRLHRIEFEIVPASEARVFNWIELWHYRDMLYFMAIRNIKARYAQSVLGAGWAILHPLLQMALFTLVFNRLARIPSDNIPYPIFSYTGLVAWQYFSATLGGSSYSLLNATNIINKIYFPRVMLPVTSAIENLVDLSVALGLLSILMVVYGITPTIWVITLPYLMLLMMLTALGLGMILAALAIQYRDVVFFMGFLTTVLMYLSPVIYPMSMVPANWRYVYGLNPMAGVIESFRAALLHTGPMPWDLVALGTLTSIIIFIAGLVFFQRREAIFSDVA